MLAPHAEVHFEERDLLKLGVRSSRIYPEWVAELETDSQINVGYRAEGTLIVGVDRDDARELEHHYASQQLLDLKVDWLTGAEAREMEPLLSPKITAAIWSKDDHQVDNRAMVDALIEAYRNVSGSAARKHTCRQIEIVDGKATGIWVKGNLEEADVIVLAAGCWSSDIDGLPKGVQPPVRPVKGQMLALQMEEGIVLQRVIRAPRAKYPADVYLVPKDDGRLVIGATSEEMGFDTRLTAGGLFELLRGTWEAGREYTTSPFWRHGPVCAPEAETTRRFLAKRELKT